MKKDKNVPTYSPTILLVDDDPACVEYLRRQFHDRTSVGVLVAKDIAAARDLGKSVPIDALVTDLFFDRGKDLESEGLHDGVDLARAIIQFKPNLPTYVLSFMADDTVYQGRAARQGVPVKRWIAKSFVHKAEPDKPDSPWRIIETDLLKERFGDMAEGDLDTAVSLAVRLRRPLRTYIQELPDPKLVVKKPIEVICTLDEDDLAKATAPALGLLHEGYGESIQEALSELAGEIQNHYIELTGDEVNAVNYATELRRRLNDFVAEGP